MMAEQEVAAPRSRRPCWRVGAVLGLSALALVAAAGLVTRGTSWARTSDVATTDNTLNVVTYNLYWWCVSDMYGNCPQFANGAGFNQLHARISANGPVDLIGLQECNNVAQVIGGTAVLSKFDYFVPPAGNDAPMAWNTDRFHKLEGPGMEYVAKDQYGDRHVNWVRLADQTTGKTILFANTHGPLNQCGGFAGDLVAQNYINAIHLHQKAGDVIVFTGDFNCGSNEETILKLKTLITDAAVDQSYGGADHIFLEGLQTVSSAAVNGAPSDHQLLKASIRMQGLAPPPPPSGGCPTSGNGGCCTTCPTNHFCPSNKGCYTTNEAGCAGGYCPVPGVVSLANQTVVTDVLLF